MPGENISVTKNGKTLRKKATLATNLLAKSDYLLSHKIRLISFRQSYSRSFLLNMEYFEDNFGQHWIKIPSRRWFLANEGEKKRWVSLVAAAFFSSQTKTPILFHAYCDHSTEVSSCGVPAFVCRRSLRVYPFLIDISKQSLASNSLR